MNRIVPLARTPLVQMVRFDHPAGVPHHDPVEERVQSHSISFVEAGAYEFAVGRQRWRTDSSSLVAWQPEMVYRVRHLETRPSDVSLALQYSDDYVEGIASAVGSARPPGPVLPLDNRLAYLRLLLLRLAAAPDATALETLAGDLFAAVVTFGGRPSRRHYGARQLAWYTARVQAVRERLDQGGPGHSLAELARYVGMSPFHLAHIFRELTGTPPHRYLMESRLRRAAQRLRDGESVTAACYAVGFSNLSHFIRLFSRRYCTTPSRYARW